MNFIGMFVRYQKHKQSTNFTRRLLASDNMRMHVKRGASIQLPYCESVPTFN